MHSSSPLDSILRVPLVCAPTPLQYLPRLTEELRGPRIWIKRDDLTGLATGGNKTRKLEFLMAEAQSEGADCVITAGGTQSNHCRQTAAAAAKLKMDCHLVLGGQPTDVALGNLLLDRLLGAQVHWVNPEQRVATMDQLAEQLRTHGQSPYVIPIGGSNSLGTLGYVAAMRKLHDQMRQHDVLFDTIVFATSSGGTQAGLMLGARLEDFAGKLLAISIDQVPDDDSDVKFTEHLRETAAEAANRLGESVDSTDFEPCMNYDFLGQGYGVVGELERDAIHLMARTEGVLVGPVYTGRALGGMVQLIREGDIGADQTVLFWHTGDEAALHAYSKELVHDGSA